MTDFRGFPLGIKPSRLTLQLKSKTLKKKQTSPNSSVERAIQATSFIVRAARAGFAVKAYPVYTIFWFYKGYRVLRVTLPVKITQVVANETDTSLQIILPLLNQYRFYSKWVTAVTVLSDTMRAAVFTKFYQFQLIGYNYQAEYTGTLLILRLGYSHTNIVPVPFNVFIQIDSGRKLAVFSTTARAAASFAALIASLRGPNPYTGKGLLPEFRTLRLKKKK